MGDAKEPGRGLAPTLEEHEDVQKLIVAASVCASLDPQQAAHAKYLTAGLIAIVAAKYGELEKKRRTEPGRGPFR
jgi:hypothetical protein